MIISHESTVEFSEVGKEYPGYVDVFAKVLVGKPQNWADYTMKLFEIKPNGHTDKHTHDYLHIMFVISGKGIVMTDGVDHEVEAGSYVFFTPDVEHQISNPFAEDLRYTFTTTNYDVFISEHK